MPFDKYSACIGTIDGFDLHGYLEVQAGRSVDRDALEAACNDRWNELMRNQPLLPGIADTVAAAKGRGTVILAAKRAGIFCIVVPNSLTRQLALDMADQRLNSLEEFDLDDV